MTWSTGACGASKLPQLRRPDSRDLFQLPKLHLAGLKWNRGGTNRVFGTPCFCPLPKGAIWRKQRNWRICILPTETRVSLLRPPKTTKMTIMAGVTQAKAWFRNRKQNPNWPNCIQQPKPKLETCLAGPFFWAALNKENFFHWGTIWIENRNWSNHSLTGPRNRWNAILSLLQPLDSYRTPSAIGSAIGSALSRLTSHPHAGGSSQPPFFQPLSGLDRTIVVLIVSQSPLKQARNKSAIEAASELSNAGGH